jgi:indole-3-glycerol phosphate synthase
LWAYRTIAELNVSRTGTEAQEISDKGWLPPRGTLGELVQGAERRKPEPFAEFKGHVPPFGAALCRDFISVIAEIKRASPSRGLIRGDLDAIAQAANFERGGARAISVLTEPTRFLGSVADIARVRATTQLPILKKDFHTKPEHFIQAKALGASAALLIVRAVPPSVLLECMAAAREVALEVLVEVHTDAELDLAVKSGAEIIGVNARNLETLDIDHKVHERLLPRIPETVIAVAESGMSTRLDMRRVADQGADAALIGSSLSQAPDVVGLLRSLSSVTRRPHDRSN